MREVLAEILRAEPGVELVGAAETAQEAIAAFETHRPEVVILDFYLRGSSGLEVLDAIKRRAPACQVVMFTSHDADAYREHCLAAGADHFFSKTRQDRELIQFLRTLGGAKPARAAKKNPRP